LPGGICKAKFQNFSLFESGWNEMKNDVWHVCNSLAFFDGVGMKKHCLAFFKTYGSVTAIGLELYNFFSGQRPLFSARFHSRRCKRLAD